MVKPSGSEVERLCELLNERARGSAEEERGNLDAHWTKILATEIRATRFAICRTNQSSSLAIARPLDRRRRDSKR